MAPAALTISHQQSTTSCVSLKRLCRNAPAAPRRIHQAIAPTGRLTSMNAL